MRLDKFIGKMTENGRMSEEDSDVGEDDSDVVLDEDDSDAVLDEDDLEEIIVDDVLGVEGDNSGSEEDVPENIVDVESLSAPRDDADFVFQKHTSPVFCCALDPKNCNLAVSGGQDDMAYVWEIDGGQIILECTGHKDSVMMASFSYDGSYVATGDMGGLIQVWKMSTKTMVWSDTVGDLSWMKWHHGTNALLCAITTGEIFMWKIPSGECKVVPGHGCNSDCGVIMPDGRRAAVGFIDGSVKVIELKSCAVQGSVGVGEAHSNTVLTIDAYSDNNIIATGGGDGLITLFKTQPMKLQILWSFSTNEGNDTDCVECLRFSKDLSLPLIAAGTLGGQLYILDFTKQVIRHKLNQENGVSKLLWDKLSSIVYVAGLEGVIRIYDGRNGCSQGELLGHTETILDIDLSTDGNTLISSSDDSTCRVYAICRPER